MRFHIIAFIGGFLLDLILGDPYWLPHPIRLMGTSISRIEHVLFKKKLQEQRDSNQELLRGKLLVFFVLLLTIFCSAGILFGAYCLHPFLGAFIELVMTYQILATKCLKVESMKVYHSLVEQDLEGARKAVSMIVGRDTQVLDEEGVAKAAIETVAENTSDGVIAPMLYTAVGGPVLGFVYKAINTMDSMVGYKNDTYLYFGKTAAKLDDVVNYIPARISAALMMVACLFFRNTFSLKGALAIYQRDKNNHASPNSAHTEAVAAGALGIQLAGDAVYFGKVVKKPLIGDKKRKVSALDIKKVNCLMYTTACLCFFLCVLAIFLLTYYMV